MTEEAPKPAAPAPAPGAKKPRLTGPEWAKIEAAWEAGATTYSELVKVYGRSVTTFQQHFKKRGIKKGAAADKLKARAEKQLEQASQIDANILAARIKETKEDHYKMAAALSRLTWQEILAAKQAGHPVATAQGNLKAVDAAMTVLKKAREERYSVLGLDRPDAIDADEIPELVISELTAEQVQKLRDRDHLEVDGLPAPNQNALDDADQPDDEEEDDLVNEGDVE
jgi:hypothetical protein